MSDIEKTLKCRIINFVDPHLRGYHIDDVLDVVPERLQALDAHDGWGVVVDAELGFVCLTNNKDKADLIALLLDWAIEHHPAMRNTEE